MTDIFKYVQQQVAKQTDKQLSILKFMDVVNSLLIEMLNIKSLKELDPLIPQFVAHATYERRNKRKNMKEKYLDFKELIRQLNVA